MTAQKNTIGLKRCSASPRSILRRAGSESQNVITKPTVHFQVQTDPERDLKITRQANALARMSIELSIHDMNRRLTNLQDQVKTLSTDRVATHSLSTANDASINELRQEVFEMKQQITKLLAFSHDDACSNRNDQVMKLISELRSEVDVVKSLAVESKAVLDKHEHQTQAIDASRANAEVPTQTKQRKEATLFDLIAYTNDAATPGSRIQETLQSTRRWNRERKQSKLGEAAFVANYLKQQSKRDPGITAFLQKALKEKVSTRKKRRKSYVYTAEAFYRDVTWGDVKAVIEGDFAKDTSRVMKALMTD